MATLTNLETLHFVKGLDPVADAFSGTVYSDVVDMKEHYEMLFVIYKAAGATGTSAITVQACDDTTPSNRTAVPFWYRAITTGDTHGAMTAATTTGFTTTAGASQLYVIGVTQEQLISSGYRYVQLKAVEDANDPVLGGILIIGAQPVHATAHSSIID